MPPPGAHIPEGVQMATTQWFTYHDESRVFEEIGLWLSGVASVSGTGRPEEVRILLVTHGTLEALGVPPAIGRGFSPETVILSYGYWQRRHGGDASIVGRSLTVDARPRRVIGVMPGSFRFLNADIDIILPFQFNRSNLFLRKPAYAGIGRLKPGVTLAQANADVARLIPIWLKAWPAPPGY